MNKLIEEILWRLYYASGERVGSRRDIRFFIINELLKDFHDYTGEQLKTAVDYLKKKELINKKKDYEGSVLISLTEKGILRGINYKFRRLYHKYPSGHEKEKWDGKWRMIAFDIPRECQKGRKALVYRMKMAGFYELQESIFLYPYECKGEIDALLEIFKIKKYVRFGLLDFIDNEEKIKIKYNLNQE
jgi:DNA-binding transcriptional regulator PaaX